MQYSYVGVVPAGRAVPKTAEPKSQLTLARPPSAQLGPEDVRRTIVLMVDDLGLSFESMAFVRRALLKFVNRQMQPGDLFAVCRTGTGSGMLQQFTSDRRLLGSVIEGLRWNPNGRSGVNVWEPLGTTAAIPNSGVLSGATQTHSIQPAGIGGTSRYHDVLAYAV